MQIKEVQEKLKISSYTLRYYEKMGLIQPYRDENGYRNYSEEDIHKIERIMFLRDINVPIEDIKDILDWVLKSILIVNIVLGTAAKEENIKFSMMIRVTNVSSGIR